MDKVRAKIKQPPANRRFTSTDAVASAEFCRSIEIVDWLIANPLQRNQIDWLATQIGDLGREVVGGLSVAQTKRLGDHFWCDATVALVIVIEEMLAAKDEAIKAFSAENSEAISKFVLHEVLASRRTSYGTRPGARKTRLKTRAELDARERLTEDVISPALERLVHAVVDPLFAPVEAPLQVTLLKLRLVTLLLCPDPFAHKNVLEHCLKPVVGDQAKEEAQRQLMDYLKN